MSGSAPRLLPAVGLALAVAALSTALLPGCAPWGGAAATAAILLRRLADRRGRSVLKPRAAAALRALLPFGVALTLWAQSPTAAEGAGAFASILLAVEVLTLLSPARGFTTALLLAISAAQVACLALRVDGPVAAGPVLAYAASLVLALAALERAASPLGMALREAGTKRVVAPGTEGVARSASLVVATRLLGIGLPFGILLFAALPPILAPNPGTERRDPRATAHARLPDLPTRTGQARSGPAGAPDSAATPDDPGAEWKTGARTRMRLGFVERIKNDDTPMLLVRVGPGDRGPAPLRLRGLAYDVFTGTEWQRSPAAQREAKSLAAGAGAWQVVAPEPSGSALWRLTVTDLAGQPEGPLFLLPEPERVRLTASAAAAKPFLAADGTVYAPLPLAAGPAYEEEARDAPLSATVRAGASSTGVSAPLLTYGRPPPDLAIYLALAREAVGEETRPVARAERISEWLRRRCKYSLSLPDLDRSRPVLDFLTRARQGPCEYFASALTLMLRSLGHPARYVVGVRGGEWQQERRSWLFRGTHAHGWTELWLDGLGWETFDPTPRDEDAVDFETVEVEAPAPAPPEDEGWLSRFLGGGGERPGFLKEVRGLVASGWGALGTALRVAIPAAVVLLTVLLLRGRRRRRALAASGVAGLPRGLGAYGRALAALRDAGIARPRSSTPAEFAGAAARALPPAAEPFRALTRRFEEERYGEREPTAQEAAAMAEEADAVRAAALARRDGTKGAPDRPERPERLRRPER